MQSVTAPVAGSGVVSSVKRSIQVQFIKEGVHRFPGATAPEFKTGDQYDVSYLANEHSHYFYFTVQIAVTHNDRDIEFLQFRRWLESLYGPILAMDYKSCEMLAEELIVEITKRYPGRWMKVSVFEDNINGAHLEFTPEPQQ